MDDLILSIKKRVLLPTIFCLGLITWFILCRAFYQSYWEEIILRVQTVDFNLLHHLMPTTLSELMIAKRPDLIEAALNANFGLFNVVVTDPTGQSVLYATKGINQADFSANGARFVELKRAIEPPDWLSQPPPLIPQWKHNSINAYQSSTFNGKPEGKILGKVFYLRHSPPTFWQDLRAFLCTSFYDLSGTKRGYLLISLSTFGFGLVVVLLIWLRRRSLELKQQELEHLSCELDLRKRALDQLGGELTAQKARKFWLEREAEESYSRALSLKQSLELIRDSIAPKLAKNVSEPSQPFKVRPPVHPGSSILEEIAAIIPDLDRSAHTLKSQAELLHEHCTLLETRQKEMQRIVQEASNEFGVQTPSPLDIKLH